MDVKDGINKNGTPVGCCYPSNIDVDICEERKQKWNIRYVWLTIFFVKLILDSVCNLDREEIMPKRAGGRSEKFGKQKQTIEESTSPPPHWNRVNLTSFPTPISAGSKFHVKQLLK